MAEDIINQTEASNQEYHATGMTPDHPVLIRDGAYLHLLPDGKHSGRFGLITRDTQHVRQLNWEFEGKCIECGQKDFGSADFAYVMDRYPKVEVSRHVELQDGKNIHETFLVSNNSSVPVTIPFTVTVEAGFKSIFEVREEGTPGSEYVPFNRAIQTQSSVDKKGNLVSRFGYRRQDNDKFVSTTFTASASDNNKTSIAPAGTADGANSYRFEVTLQPGESTSFSNHALSEHGMEIRSRKQLEQAAAAIGLKDTYAAQKMRNAATFAHAASLPSLEDWRQEFGIAKNQFITKEMKPFVQAVDHLHAMMTLTDQGIILCAGVPNFMNPFGRDQLETALKIMPDDPKNQPLRCQIVQGILRFLAANQGLGTREFRPPPSKDPDAYQDRLVAETRGDIPHEIHYDERSGLGLKPVHEQEANDRKHKPLEEEYNRRFAQEHNRLPEGEECYPRLKRVPFGAFYGTADTALLFASVLNEYNKVTGDEAFQKQMEPCMEKIRQWVTNQRDANLFDKHGFLCYHAIRNQLKGGPLTNKVWKDSFGGPAFVDTDGKVKFFITKQQPQAKIAYIEVQGYLYRFYRECEESCRIEQDKCRKALENEKLQGEKRTDMEAALAAQAENERMYNGKAENLQKNVREHFFTVDKEGKPVCAMAVGYHVNSAGQPLQELNMVKMNVHSSNPAHALWTGVFGKDVNAIIPILDSLMDPCQLWSGWGVRTLAPSCKNSENDTHIYNNDPDKAYHNGPVWPYEPIIKGLRPYACKGNRAWKAIESISTALYEQALASPNGILAEMISGEPRKIYLGGKSKPPVVLNTSSVSQTWSSAELIYAALLRRQLGMNDLTSAKGRVVA